MILNEVENYLEGVSWHGDYLSACCVFHEDQNPSMMVFETGFKCLSCGEKGSLQKLLARINKSDILPQLPPSTRKKSPWYKWLNGRSVQELAWDAHQMLKRNPSQGVYLKQRGIGGAIENLMLGWLGGYYFFPILDKRAQVNGLVVRAGKSLQEFAGVRYMTPPGQSPTLYVPSWKLVEEREEITVVYGIIDAITLFLLDKAVITGSAGKSIKAELFDDIRKPITIIPDHNEDADALILASALGWRGKVNRISYPEDSKDCNDLYLHHGKQHLLSVI